MITHRFHLLLFSCLLFAACQSRVTKSGATVDYKQSDLIQDAYFQKEVGGGPRDSSHTYLHLRLKENSPENVELDQVNYLGQSFLLDGLEKQYKFKLQPADQLPGREANVSYLNKNKQGDVIDKGSFTIEIHQKENLYLP